MTLPDPSRIGAHSATDPGTTSKTCCTRPASSIAGIGAEPGGGVGLMRRAAPMSVTDDRGPPGVGVSSSSIRLVAISSSDRRRLATISAMEAWASARLQPTRPARRPTARSRWLRVESSDERRPLARSRWSASR
jgi:hypothetical protein